MLWWSWTGSPAKFYRDAHVFSWLWPDEGRCLVVRTCIHSYLFNLSISPKTNMEIENQPFEKKTVFQTSISSGSMLVLWSYYRPPFEKRGATQLRQPHFCCFRDTWELILHHLLAPYVFFFSIFWTFSCRTMWNYPLFCQATVGSHATETTGVVCRGEVVVSLKVQGGPPPVISGVITCITLIIPFKKAI